ncbi:uncharacterized protein LOC135951063 isoform X2 [Calliphora vicina]|uniref:uncharacterized protein LOC135951063 isoform X2 n=1 Tax=Calliphora vicina TaxID=7373 RepID=UPI00325BA499
MSQFSRQHFGDIDIKELIHHYKQYDCLWNYNSPDYKSKTAKQQAWTEIADYFQKDVNEVKRKVKYLRSAYVAEKKKVSRKCSDGTPYKPSLFYYNELDFLHNIVVWRKVGSDAEHTDVEFISPDAVEDEELLTFIDREEEVDLKQPEINFKAESFIEHDAEPEHSPPQMPMRSSPKIMHPRSLASRPLKRKISGDIKPNKSAISNVPSSPTVNNSQCKNLYISFGKTIALQLQQLPLDVAILAMSEIHTILTKKTLEHITSSKNGHESWSQSESEDSYSELIEEAFNDSS